MNDSARPIQNHRVVHIVSTVSPNGGYGGPLRVAVNQVKSLTDLGHEAILVAGARDFEGALPTSYAGVPVKLFASHTVVPKSGYTGLYAPGLMKWLRTELRKTDIVHIHLCRDLVTLPAANVVRRRGIAYVVQPHGMLAPSRNPLAKPLDNCLTQRVLKSAASVICLTAQEILYVKKIAGNSVNTKLLHNALPDEIAFRADKSTRPEIIFVGRLHKYKRPLHFVNMAIVLAKEYPDIIFTLIGPDEGEAVKVVSLIDEHGLTNRIKWIGSIHSEKIYERIEGSTLSVSTSVNESFGMSIIESLALGVPVVIGHNYPIADSITNSGAGIIYDGSVDNLITVVRSILSGPHDLQKMSQDGIKYVNENYQKNIITDKLLSIYTSSNKAQKVVIIQPYIPRYRVRFFELLTKRLAESHIQLVVAAGQPRGTQALRGDSVTPDWMLPCDRKILSIGGRELEIGGYGQAMLDADGIIVGLMGSSITTYRAIFSKFFNRNRKVGVWGHIKSYINEPHPIDAALESWQLRISDRVFAYTEGGGQYALNKGISSDKLTVVKNSIDTSALLEEMKNTTEADTSELINRMDLRSKKVFFFVGGLDESKRISFLAEVLDVLMELDDTVHIVVGGDGEQRSHLEKSVARGQVTMLGHANDETKARISRLSQAIVMPGRIGLVAVESLLLQIPIITTDFKYHAPESEYLTEGETLFTVISEPNIFAQFLSDFKAPKMVHLSDYPSLDQMVDNFANGIEKMMKSKSD